MKEKVEQELFNSLVLVLLLKNSVTHDSLRPGQCSLESLSWKINLTLPQQALGPQVSSYERNPIIFSKRNKRKAWIRDRFSIILAQNWNIS